MAEPSRRNKIVMGLRLAFALTEEEAEHMLRMYTVDLTRGMQAEINTLPEPKVWSAPLKWWRKGRDAALEVVTEDILRTAVADREFDKKGHKIK